MLHDLELPESYFSILFMIDQQLADAVQAGGCADCGGPLHQGHYQRKPRGGRLAKAGEQSTLRLSLCCGRRGCRHRSTPPSVRFLGRRVYLEATILLACTFALTTLVASAIKRATAVPVRTVRRWLTWWQTVFPRSAVFAQLRSRTVGAVTVEQLPGSMVNAFEGSLPERVHAASRWLLPLTTTSVDATRFLRVG